MVQKLCFLMERYLYAESRIKVNQNKLCILYKKQILFLYKTGKNNIDILEMRSKIKSTTRRGHTNYKKMRSAPREKEGEKREIYQVHWQKS